MIKFENTEVVGWRHAIRGMRNPMNSWDKSDSGWQSLAPSQRDDYILISEGDDYDFYDFWIGPNDAKLMENLSKAGTDHRKFMRMIAVYVDITAPLYWWKEFDTYKIGTVANSCSTMHKIHAKEFTLEDFSHEHLIDVEGEAIEFDNTPGDYWNSMAILDITVRVLNMYRQRYLQTKDKKYWWQMIQLLPSSYNQKRTVMMNYEVLANIYKSRKNHKLDEWSEHKNVDIETLKRYYGGTYKLLDEKSLSDIGFCDWIKTLPYSELIIGKEKQVWILLHIT